MENNICASVAMSKLISYCAQSKVRNREQSILRVLFIDDWKSESHYQHHNFSEHRYQKVKILTNTIIYRTGAPAYTCLLDLIYVFFLLNHTHASGINGIPTTNYAGSTADISPLLLFRFWKPVYYKVDYSYFPSHSTEKCGCWVGISEHVGHAMIFKVVTNNNQTIMSHSYLCSSE